VNGQLHAPAALIPSKQQWHPLNKRLGGSQSWFYMFWRKEKSPDYREFFYLFLFNFYLFLFIFYLFFI